MALTVAEVRSQIAQVCEILEVLRVKADAMTTETSGDYDELLAILEGDYTPAALSVLVAQHRAGLSDLLSGTVARSMIEPCLFEYAKFLSPTSGYTNAADIFEMMYEQGVTVKSRAITHDEAATAGGSNVGNAVLSRLYKGAYDEEIEGIHVETKVFRCRSDQNTGTKELAESWECIGQPASPDNLQLMTDASSPKFGSGEASRKFIRNSHSGTGAGGSLLRNSGFSTYSATATPKFLGWDLVSGTQPTQYTAAQYLASPGSTTVSCLSSATNNAFRVKQTLANMRISSLDPNTPYALRIMVNKTIGSGSGGNVILHCGSEEHSTAVSSIGSNWQEIIMPLDKGCWLKEFNQDPFDIEFEWHAGGGSLSGYLVFDDAIFVPMTEIDGTWWFLRHNNSSPVPNMVDDTYTFTDTGGLPETGIVQWWLWRAGFGYLRTAGSPNITDPT